MSTATEYVAAVDSYHLLLDKYFRIKWILNGGSVMVGEPLTSLARRELNQAYDKMNDAKKKLDT
jgi:hypothetical protein